MKKNKFILGVAFTITLVLLGGSFFVAVNAALLGMINAFNSATGNTFSGVASIVNSQINMKTWEDLRTMAIYVILGLVMACLAAGRCNLLALEDRTVQSLGVNVSKSRIVISGIAVLLASISTAIIGPVSFLGLIVAHIGKILVGTDHKVLIPYSIILGSTIF